MNRRNPRKIRIAVAAFVFLGMLLLFLDFRGLVPVSWLTPLADIQLVPALLRGVAGMGMVVFLLWVITALLAGRIYCSTVCPLGILQDVIWRVRKMMSPKRLRFSKTSRLLRYGVFFLVTIPAFVGIWVGLTWLDPYSLFGRIATGVFRPLVVGANNALVPLSDAAGSHFLYRISPSPLVFSSILALGFLCALAALAAWRGRIFCNTICPVGTFLGVLSRHAIFRLSIDKSRCETCGDCLQVCKAQCIDLKNQEIDFSRCVACFDCVSVCDQHGISYRRTWISPTPSPAEPTISRRIEADIPPLSHGGFLKKIPRLHAPSSSSDTPFTTDPALRRSLGILLAGFFTLGTPALAKSKGTGGNQGRGQKSRRGNFEGKFPPILPPGAFSLEHFLTQCTACGLCVSNCPTQTLQPSFLEYGWRGILKPHVNPEIGYCNFDCIRCIDVCPTGALLPLSLRTKQRTQLGKAIFHKRNCIVHTDGTDCAACSEHCPTKAVDTVPYRGHLLLPQVNEDLCIGCGACEHACPVRPERAIRVSGLPVQTSAAPAKNEAPTARPADNDFPF